MARRSPRKSNSREHTTSNTKNHREARLEQRKERHQDEEEEESDAQEENVENGEMQGGAMTTSDNDSHENEKTQGETKLEEEEKEEDVNSSNEKEESSNGEQEGQEQAETKEKNDTEKLAAAALEKSHNETAAAAAAPKPVRRSNRSRHKPGSSSAIPETPPETWDDLIEFFSTYRDDSILDDDEIVAKIHKTHKTGKQLAHNYKSLTGGDGYDHTLLEQCIAQAQDRAVADEIVHVLSHQCRDMLDRRSMAWVKRTLQKDETSSSNWLLQKHARGGRMTRGAAKSHKKKRETGLDVLKHAVRSLEKERGTRFRREEPKPPVQQRMEQEEDETNKATRTRKETRPYHKRKSAVQDEDSTRQYRPGGPPICLRTLEEERLEEGEVERDTSMKNYRKRQKTHLPPEYQKLGLDHRLPTWDDIVPMLLSEEERTGGRNDSMLPPQSGGDFCCDLDHSWYHHEETKHGQKFKSDGNSMTWVANRHWKSTRRTKHRRFSRPFVQSMIEQRNEYRQAVRFFQSHPNLLPESGFPFEVSARIPAGTRVIVRNGEGGVVLQFDEPTSGYRIQLDSGERKLFPDSVVTSLKGPKSVQEVKPSAWAEGSSLATADASKKSSLPVMEELKKLARFDPLDYHSSFSTANKLKHPPGLVEETAEREALVSLMASIKKLLRRQDELLDASESLDELLSGIPDATVLACHRAWLKEGIQRTDLSLRKVLQYMQLFYGSLYLPSDQLAQQKSSLTREDAAPLFEKLPTTAAEASTKTLDSADSLQKNTEEIAVGIVGKVIKGLSLDTAKGKEDRVASCFVAAGNLLLVSSFASSDLASPQLALALTKECRAPFPDLEEDFNEGNDLLVQFRQNRQEALNDVREAMQMLHTELAISSLAGDAE